MKENVSILANHDLFIAAEIGGNHLGDKQRLMQLVTAAANSGANGVKFQCLTPEQMVGDPSFTIPSGPWSGKNLLDLYRETHTPQEWFSEAFDLARSLGLVPFASVFHEDDVAFMENMDCQMYKIS